MRTGSSFAVIVAATVLGVGAAATPAAAKSWIGAWHGSPQRATVTRPVAGRTVRHVIYPHIGNAPGQPRDPRWRRVRVRLSNRYGQLPLKVGPVYLGLSGDGAEIKPGSNRPVLFGGEPTVTIPVGADVVSDPVNRPLRAFRNTSVSIHFPEPIEPETVHRVSFYDSHISLPGDHTAEDDGTSYVQTTTSWYVLTGLDVLLPESPGVVVVLGDAISEVASSNSNNRFPDFLARRLATACPVRFPAVLNAALGGNRILNDSPSELGDSGLRRFTLDVLAQPGVTDVILQLGTNDIGLPAPPVTLDEIIVGMKQFAARARASGVRVFATTQTPAGGSVPYVGHGTPAAIAMRDEVNRWILGEGAGWFDGVFDFAAAVADPNDHGKLATEYDYGDGVHLSDAGNAAIANAVDLDLLTRSSCGASPS